MSTSSFASDLRGFGFAGIAVLLLVLLTGNIFIGKIIVPVGASLVLIWVVWSKTHWKEIGYVKTNRWFVIIIIGITGGIAFKLLMKSVVMPLFGTPPINQTFHYLAGNVRELPYAIWAMVVAGFAEETVFRGYLFERFGKLFGKSIRVKIGVVIITSIWFGASHYYNQGIPGVIQGFLFGLVFGGIYALRPQIWVLMIAHTAFDLTALYIIYYDLETTVAHWFFNCAN